MDSTRIGLGIATLLISVIGASAADLPVKYKAPPLDSWSWNGLYWRHQCRLQFWPGHVRCASFRRPSPTRTCPADRWRIWRPARIQLAGRTCGVQTEGDAQWTTRGSGCAATCIQNFNDETSVFRLRHEVDWFATARARLGYANAGYLFYVTGGAAWSGVRETATAQSDNSVASATVKKVVAGWAFGGGVEGRLSQNWTVKVEYLHLDFSPTTTTTRLATTAGLLPFDTVSTVNSRVTDNIVRVGLNYRLWNTPAAAPLPSDPAAAAWRWTGLYAGLNGGYGVGNTSFREFKYFDPAAPPLPGELTHYISSFAGQKVSPQGALAGGQVGYNWQFDRVVVGVEGDAQWGGQKDTACAMTCPETLTQQFNWLATVRARAGYADRGYLLYVTAGGALPRIKRPTFFRAAWPTTPHVPDCKGGWVAGGGIEARLLGNWTGKIEYLHFDSARSTPLPGPEAFFTALGSHPAFATTSSASA